MRPLERVLVTLSGATDSELRLSSSLRAPRAANATTVSRRARGGQVHLLRHRCGSLSGERSSVDDGEETLDGVLDLRNMNVVHVIEVQVEERLDGLVHGESEQLRLVGEGELGVEVGVEVVAELELVEVARH